MKKQQSLDLKEKQFTIKQGIEFGLTTNIKSNLEWLDELEKYACINPLLYGVDRETYLDCIEEMRKEQLAQQ